MCYKQKLLAGIRKNVLSTVLFLNTVVSKSCKYTVGLVMSGKEPMFSLLKDKIKTWNIAKLPVKTP